jgi:regulator of RNase E activity RraA
MDTSTPEGDADLDLYWKQLEEIEREELPVVWVVKTVGSRPDHECVLGDGMAKTLFAAGCIGAVTDGGVRDIAGLLTVPFAAYARLKTIHHTNMRVRSAGEPVRIGGITVKTGDVVHADSGGVIRIPATSIEDLPRRAIQMLAFEREAHLELRRTGIKLSEKRERVNSLLRKYGFR